MRRLLYKTHIWLGWIVGVQLLLWMLSGLLMSAMPIETVRGEHLRAQPLAAALPVAAYLPPERILADTPADSLTLTRLLERPVYRLERDGRPFALRDALTGAEVRIDKALAAEIAKAHYTGSGGPVSVTWTDAVDAPREFRREVPAFAVRFDEGTFYIHGITGEVVAVRTDRWRLYDLMWGLHIMDWRGREDFNHPLLIGAAALGTLSVLGGIGLLLFRLRRRRRKGGAPAVAPV